MGIIITTAHTWIENCTKFGQLILSKIIKNCCHQLPDVKANMHEIRLRLGLRPRPRWGGSQRSPDSLAEFKGLLLMGEGGREGKEGTGEWEEGTGGKEEGTGKWNRGRGGEEMGMVASS